MSLDPEIQVLIDGMAEADTPPLHEMAPEDARALYAAMSQMLDTVDTPIGRSKTAQLAKVCRYGFILPSRAQAFCLSWFSFTAAAGLLGT